MNIEEIKKAVVERLRKEFPGVAIYGNETVDGYTKPCFFVEISTVFSEGNVNQKYKSYTIEITKVQRVPDESDSLRFFDIIEKSFWPKLYVGKRALSTSNFIQDYTGENNNVPKADFDVDFYDRVEKVDASELMREFRIKGGIKKGIT